MDIKSLVDNLLEIADNVVPLIGGPSGVAALAVAHSVIKALDDVRSHDVGDTTALEQRLEALETAVMAHADKTISSLD